MIAFTNTTSRSEGQNTLEFPVISIFQDQLIRHYFFGIFNRLKKIQIQIIASIITQVPLSRLLNLINRAKFEGFSNSGYQNEAVERHILWQLAYENFILCQK